MSDLKHVTDATFAADVLGANGPVLVDFWAEWCGPCRQIAPALEEIAQELDGKIAIAKIDIDKNPQTPQKYNVRGIPTLLIFKNGELVANQVGALPKSRLKSWIEKAL